MGEDHCADKASSSSGGGGGFQLSDNDLDKIINALGSRYDECIDNSPSEASQRLQIMPLAGHQVSDEQIALSFLKHRYNLFGYPKSAFAAMLHCLTKFELVYLKHAWKSCSFEYCLLLQVASECVLPYL